MIIDVAVENAYSLGGIPLSVQGVANIKIAAKDPTLGNAVERLMGKSRDEVIRIAKEILEGNLRGVLSQLTPEEVNEDKIKFAEKLLVEADQDLSKLGLSLDTMKIQAVHDDRGYLDSIGRQKSAEIVKTARIAEARAKADAIQRDATNRQRARLREFEAN
jgi:flotillin